MKVRVSSEVFCISWILLLISSKCVTSDLDAPSEIEALRKAFATNLPFVVDKLPGNALNAVAFVLYATREAIPSTKDILDQLKTVDETVNRIESTLEVPSDSIPHRVVNFMRIQDAETQYNRIVDFIEAQSTTRRRTKHVKLLQFNAEGYLDENGASLFNRVKELKNLLTHRSQDDQKSLLDKYHEEVSRRVSTGGWCGAGLSLNEFIYQKYRFFMMNVLQGYALLVESCDILAEWKHGNYGQKKLDLLQEYAEFKREFGKKIGALLAQSSVSIRRCDPLKHERGKNFLEFEKLIQGYLVPLRHLTPGRSEPLSCDTYANLIDYNHTEDRSNFYSQTCNGNVYNCMLTAGRALCPASTPSRRFDGLRAHGWLRNRYFPDLGNLSACGDSDTNSRFIDITYAGAASKWTEHNSCGCLCDDWKDPTSFRTIDLNPAFSRYEDNMVITGLRLVNDSNVLRIEVQQGKLERFGAINATSLRWLKHSEQPARAKRPVALNMQRRKINLNTVTIPADEAMIGVEFDFVDDELLYLKVHTAPVLYDRGILQRLDKYPIYKPEKPKSELKLHAPTIPSLASWNLRIDGEDKFITLQPSDWEKDAAQTLVPFLDLQEVVTTPPALLSGVNFAYRSRPGYGGFLSLELNSVNYTDRVLRYSSGRAEFP